MAEIRLDLSESDFDGVSLETGDLGDEFEVDFQGTGCVVRLSHDQTEELAEKLAPYFPFVWESLSETETSHE